MNLLIEIWKKYVYPKFNDAKLFVTPCGDKSIRPYNIFERKLNDRIVMINDLLKSKILLVPGHKAELYCLAAEEARELCLPIVTLGIGSLSERVEHGKTGFIAKNKKDFADYTIQLFKDNLLWRELRSNLLKLRGSKTWEKSANIILNEL